MKKIKIKKCMTSFLMLAVMVVSIIGVMPKTIAYAKVEYEGQIQHLPHYKFICYWQEDGKTVKQTISVGSSENKKIYLIEFNYKKANLKRYLFASYGDFKGTNTIEVDGKSNTTTIDSYSNSCDKYGHVYISTAVSIGGNPPRLKYDMDSVKDLISDGKTDLCSGENMETHFCAKVCNYEGRYTGDMEMVIECGEGIPDGSADNPIRDENVGYPDIYDYQFLIVKPKPLTGHFDNTDGDYDKLKNADYFKWKSKSTTGFSLTSPSDEYKDVYIQTKIVSKFKYNDKMNGKGEWHNYDNYGEVGYLPFVSASEKKLSVSFQQLTETLPKTFMETHNFKYQYQDYDYYFRIVYTRADDLKVIPTYYSGGWRRVSLHSNNGKHDENGEGDNSSAVIQDGDDDGGEWKKDEDSKDNDKNIDNGTTDGNDLDDAADNADNKNNSSSSGLNINNIKGFMNQVGNVPKAIGKLFTFLPDWVQQFIGFGFVVLVALMIIKAIRG